MLPRVIVNLINTYDTVELPQVIINIINTYDTFDMIIKRYIGLFNNEPLTFTIACEKNYFKIAHWMHYNEFGGDYTRAFQFSCAAGQLDILKWLVSIAPAIDVHYGDEYAFRWSCTNGHLDVAKWLMSFAPNIDVRADDDNTFRWSSGNRHFDVAKWLISIAPNIRRTHKKICDKYNL